MDEVKGQNRNYAKFKLYSYLLSVYHSLFLLCLFVLDRWEWWLHCERLISVSFGGTFMSFSLFYAFGFLDNYEYLLHVNGILFFLICNRDILCTFSTICLIKGIIVFFIKFPLFFSQMHALVVDVDNTFPLKIILLDGVLHNSCGLSWPIYFDQDNPFDSLTRSSQVKFVNQSSQPYRC